MAEIMIKKEDFSKAKELLNKLLSEFSGTAYSNVASKYYADILRKEGDLKGAIGYYENAIDNRRGDFNANIQYTIGQLYEAMGDMDNAIVEYMKVAYVYPDSTKIVVASQMSSARLFEKQVKWQDAEKIYKKISAMEVKESSYARERLLWIKRNKR
jgi:tetratricopeptide (TPR) repeat protein